MRRTTLEPPQEVAWRDEPLKNVAPPRGELPAPVPAREERRPWFHPLRGRLRRFERRADHLLSERFWPRVPGAARAYARILERHLSLSEVRVRLDGLPEPFVGRRFLFVSDLHAGPFVRPQALDDALRRLSATEPDAIFLGGDLVTCRLEELLEHLPVLGELEAPLGVFSVMGNHDHYTGRVKEMSALLSSIGIRTLDNDSTVLERGGARLSLAGVDDWLHGRADLDAALAGTRGPVILLSHNPDVFFEAARRGVALVLSGHTHAGQIRVPGLGVLVRQSRFRLDEGRYVYRGSELIVSRGLGVVGLPLRWHCSPEAVLVELAG